MLTFSATHHLILAQAAPSYVQLIVSAIVMLVMFVIVMGTVAYLILLERKQAAWMQDRHGPIRTGPWGLFQPVADGLKMFLKEDYTPGHVEKPLFILAPTLMIIPAILAIGIIPWGGPIQLLGERISLMVANIDIGLLYLLGIAGIGVWGIVLAGYSSNNKYAFLGGMRSTAMMLSYEVPLGLSILGVVLITGHLHLQEMAIYQIHHGWNLVTQPVLAIIFFTCLLAEANRLPFDLAEAEQELVGGFHTEYSSMKFGLFFLAEYSHLITGMAFFSAMFLGGWDVPLFDWWFPHWSSYDAPLWVGLVRFVCYFAKIMLLIILVMGIRWTIPRFRFDQIMRLSWTGMVPLATAMVLINLLVVYVDGLQALQIRETGVVPVIRMNSPLVLIAINLAVVAVVLIRTAGSKTVLTGRQAAADRMQPQTSVTLG